MLQGRAGPGTSGHKSYVPSLAQHSLAYVVSFSHATLRPAMSCYARHSKYSQAELSPQ